MTRLCLGEQSGRTKLVKWENKAPEVGGQKGPAVPNKAQVK